MSNVTPINPQAAQQQAAEKHFRRHASDASILVGLANGLSITQNKDGLWLNFGATGKPQASVHLDMIGPPQGHDSQVRAAIDAWQAEFVKSLASL